jgi:hypothetical protein
MNDTTNNNVTDVEFKEIPAAAAEMKDSGFQPVEYLSQALLAAGHPDPTGWTKDIDPRAVTAEEEKDRIFFANRALLLYLAEQEDRENVTVRMLVTTGVDGAKWAAIAEQGIVPWLMGKFDKPKAEEAVAETTLQEGVESAPVSDTKVDWESIDIASKPSDVPPADHVEEVREGSMDSLPGSITE